MAKKKHPDQDTLEAFDEEQEQKPGAATPRARAKPGRPAAKGGRPRIRASHSVVSDAPRTRQKDDSSRLRRGAKHPATAASPRAIAPLRKAPRPPGFAAPPSPLASPKRAAPRKTVPSTPPEPSALARSLALGIAEAGIDKKAIGIEILDVTGRVDYADFLVVMTGRSDRHVHAIATGIEEAMARRKVAPLSVEGLQLATWVLLDFGDVVVHVFQEDARRLYDIEGLWIDAGRLSLPSPTDSAAPADRPDEPDPNAPLGLR